MTPSSPPTVLALPTKSHTEAQKSAALQFHVSLNEEHVFLRLVPARGATIDLGERVHHYCLLTLARQRLHDARLGADVSSQGWLAVEALARMLGLEQTHLNIQIYRARQHVGAALPSELLGDALLERRRGEVRFGALPFRIVRGTILEGEIFPCSCQGSVARLRGAVDALGPAGAAGSYPGGTLPR